ncbi:MAG TPA: DNA mismatch repair endonuclease MutL [Clostridia bacterium]|jgi:DNA mismatch repair protein MutL|nr:DNA mismatch repair endonuclease MutL [Clostridia bacterium]
MIINVLDSSIYNRIAAGEVIERPSSVVKELIDNSIDAGATEIKVFIEQGGIKCIEVSDNGSGIPKTELYKTILPHATSKISSAEDLFSISTLGFRGEALASIAAVSEFEIKTKYHAETNGARLYSQGSEYVVADTAWTNGTIVIVKNLFYNMPARFKFLSSRVSEENNIKKVVSQFILSHPNIAFSLYCNDRLIFASEGLGLEEALQVVFGREIATGLIPLNDKRLSSNSYKIQGYISPPNLYKNNRSYQYIIVNGRVVVDSNISATVQNAYSDRLMKHAFPIFVLDIAIPFDEVDVNVHPTKREIRLAFSKKLFGSIYRSIQETLLDFELSKQAEFFQVNTLLMENKKDNNGETNNDASVNPDKQNKNDAQINKNNYACQVLFDGDSQKNLIDDSGALVDDYIPSLANIKKQSAIIEQRASIVSKEINDDNSNNTLAKSLFNQEKNISYRIVGQIFNTYLIIEAYDKVLYIDQHAAHERILFDKYNEAIQRKVVASQQMLIPFLYECTIAEHDVLMKAKETLMQLGFEIESLGVNTIRVSAIPLVLAEKINLKKVFDDIISLSMSGIDALSLKSLIKDSIASIACKAAIKGNLSLSSESIKYIIEYFFSEGMPLQCPHGRPTIIAYDKTGFEKEFKRRV